MTSSSAFAPLSPGPMVVLTCLPENQPPARLQGYARYMRFLLEGSLRAVRLRGSEGVLARVLVSRAIARYDLVIVNTPPVAWWRSRWLSPSWIEGVRRCSTSILAARLPRYPLRRILLALQGHLADRHAIGWALELAQASRASVTLLPIGGSDLPDGAVRFIDPDWILGGVFSNPVIVQQLQAVAAELAGRQLSGDVRLRSEPLWHALPAECAGGEYDLVVLGLEPFTIAENRLPSLMSALQTPVLFARSGRARVELCP